MKSNIQIKPDFSIQDCVNLYKEKYTTNLYDEEIAEILQEFIVAYPGELKTAEEVIFKFEY